jgi:hypothetical protein
MVNHKRKPLSDQVKIAIALFVDRAFNHFWNFFYHFRSNQERFEYGCFPFPLQINCIGCHGCCHNKKPPLQPTPPKGPYKAYTTDLFDQQYKAICGEGELVKLWSELDEHNKQVDEQRMKEEKEALENE